MHFPRYMFLLLSTFFICWQYNLSSAETSVHKLETTPGKELYEKKCVVCHGADGARGRMKAADLKTSQLDSTTVFEIIAEGKNRMPDYKKRFSPDEIAQITSYVMDLRR